VAVVQGAPLTHRVPPPRQSDVLLPERNRDAGCYLVPTAARATPRTCPRAASGWAQRGQVLSADDAQQVKTRQAPTTCARRQPCRLAAGAAPATAIYVSPPAEGHAQSRGELRAADAAIAADGWTRLPRR
jgi:hypothetical protein